MPEKIRILHLLEATLGGTLRYLADIVDTLPTEQFELAFAYSTLRQDPGLQVTLEHAKAKGWQVFQLDMVRDVSLAEDLHSAFRLRKLYSQFKPDIVHCHSSKAGAIGRLARIGLSNGPRILYTPNAIATALGSKYILAERILSPLTDCYGAVSEGERLELISNRLDSGDKITVIRPLVDTSFYQPQDQVAARATIGIPEDAKMIVAVGRLAEQKDPLLFVEVVRRLASQVKNLKAVWLGDGGLRPSVEAQVNRLGLEDVVVLAGWQKDIRPYLAASDLLLSTSRYESFGYMVAEALAMERPAIGSAIAGTSDIMEGPLQELLYPMGDAEAATQGVLRLLNDLPSAQSWGCLGRESIEARYSAHHLVEALTTCYTNLYLIRPRNGQFGAAS